MQPVLFTVVFFAFQGVFWALVIKDWLQLRRDPLERQLLRHWLALGSLICASIALTLTTGMTVYSKVWQRHPYDRLEGQYLFYATCISLVGIVLAAVGKRNSRIIGLLTSIFTLVVAILDAVGM